jgi:hypothetical protein
MNDTAYGAYCGFKFSGVYFVVPRELHTLEWSDEQAQAKI